MLPRAAVVALATILMLPPIVACSQIQTRDTGQGGQNEATSRLSEPERQAFDARLNAAQTEQERAIIIAERDKLIQARTADLGDVRQIPKSRYEVTEDPIMSTVPTPRSDRAWPLSTLPGGALAPTGSGTGPSTTTGGWEWGD